MRALLYAPSILALAAAAPLSLRVDCSAGASPGALAPFWRSVGYTPAEYALRDDELENTAHIGAVPNSGVKQVRIHYLLDLVVLKGSVPGSSTPSGFALDLDFRALDHAVDFLVGSGLSPGFELMGSPSGFPLLPLSFWTPYSGNGKLPPNATLAMWRQLIGDTLAHYIQRYGAAEVEGWNLETWNVRLVAALVAALVGRACICSLLPRPLLPRTRAGA